MDNQQCGGGMMKEFGNNVLRSFVPITMDEAQKFYQVDYEMAKAINPDMKNEPRLIFSVGWYVVSDEKE